MTGTATTLHGDGRRTEQSDRENRGSETAGSLSPRGRREIELEDIGGISFCFSSTSFGMKGGLTVELLRLG